MIDLGGTYRECSAEETLRRIQPWLLEPFAITRVADVTGLDDIGIDTAISYRPNAKTLSCSQGKGLSKTLAKVSALMESIETWHAEECPPADRIGSYHDLSQQERLLALDQDSLSIIPEHLPHFRLEWLQARELNSDSAVYIPRAMVCIDHQQANYSKLIFFSNTNGLASGNSFAEAMCHAVYEVIERHAYTLHGKRFSRQCDLDSIQHPLCRQMIDRIKRKGYRLYIFDCTSTINIPVYQAILDDGNQLRSVGRFFGLGCHILPHIAVLRAITEAAQSRLTYISGARDDIHAACYQPKHSALPFPDHGTLPFPAAPQTTPSSMTACLDYLRYCLMAAGMSEIVYYDLTHPQLHIPVVKVHIPQCRFDPAMMLAPIAELP
ncbi:MAG: YcaO-like family protein [Legionellaceae bacterium]|nr:YcaO-like family protein [Legionellaceae bacterium]